MRTHKERTEAVINFLHTWSNGSLRKFLQNVYARTRHNPDLATWSRTRMLKVVSGVLLWAHKSGPFPWEGSDAKQKAWISDVLRSQEVSRDPKNNAPGKNA